MKQILIFLAVMVLGTYQIIVRLGTPRVWVVVAMMSFFILMWGYALYLNREKVSVFLHRLFTFSFSKEAILTENEDKKSKSTPQRSTGDTIASVLFVVMSVLAFVGSVAGIIIYIYIGEAKNDIIRIIFSISAVCWVILIVFRRRKRYSWRVKRFLRRR